MIVEKKYKDKDWLFYQYFNLKKSSLEIAKECSCDKATVRNWIQKFGGKLRSHSEAQKGNKNHNWKGGRGKNGGYWSVLKKEHPRAFEDGYVYEHILVAEEMLGRPIRKEERIHHINFIKLDNRKENLFVCKNMKEHGKISKSVFNLISVLMEKGIIKFNKDKKDYEFTKKMS